MECDRAREQLSTDPESGDAELRAHLETCADCKREREAQRLLTAALLERLPQYPASLALKRRLAASVNLEQQPRRTSGRVVILALGAAAAIAVAVLIPARSNRAREALAESTVAEHLSVLRGSVPLAVVSSGIHEVKPWFAGKLDFVPAISFGGDADFPLQGGAVARYFDRPAALLEFKRRAHRISLFVFVAKGLPLEAGRSNRTLRGFHLISWQKADLGYALISDLDAAELSELAARLAGNDGH